MGEGGDVGGQFALSVDEEAGRGGEGGWEVGVHEVAVAMHGEEVVGDSDRGEAEWEMLGPF